MPIFKSNINILVKLYCCFLRENYSKAALNINICLNIKQ